MSQKILVFNTGSTTLNYKLFEIENGNLLIDKKGMIENIGVETGPKNHKMALSILFQGIGIGVPSLAKIENLIAIGHRVVHGGNEFKETTLINKDVIKRLKKYNLNAPLHNPHIIQVMEDVLANSGTKGHRDIPNYAVFDSTFFTNLPCVAKVYPLPYRMYEELGIRRLGFHGISHKYSVQSVIKKNPEVKKIISLHLGGGCSITASINGEPIDTSMGFTPLEGLMMTTRSGDIDAGIIHYLIEKKIIRHTEVDVLLNCQSGLLGISGLDSDMRELLSVASYPVEDEKYQFKNRKKFIDDKTIERTKLAIDMFVYRIRKYIGSYVAILGGCDALIFTGRMATGSSFIRKMILKNMDHLLINTKIEVIESNEEEQIAKEILIQCRK